MNTVINKFVAATLALAMVFGIVIFNPVKSNADAAYSLSGTAHVQDIGDKDGTFDNGTLLLGTSGQSRRLERVTINFTNNTGYEGSIRYKVHVQNIGWMDWVEAGNAAGTSGKSLRLEGIKIELTGELAKHYSVQYHVHIENYGDAQSWVSDGAVAGTTGESLRLENLSIKLVPLSDEGTETISYRVQRQNKGWETKWLSDGEVSGTTGESLRLEAITITVTGNHVTGGITYRTHVQNIGWQDWVTNGDLSGTVGESKRLEAIEIKLTGDLADKYDVYYRVHAQDYGWLGWAVNGETSGTSGLSKRLEAIQIMLVAKGGEVPGDVEGIKSDKDESSYSASDTYVPTVLSQTYTNKFLNVCQSNIALLNSSYKEDATPVRTYTFVDMVSANEHASTSTISDADWAALESFANANFDPTWTPAECLLYTMYWIHYNVDYSTGSSNYAVSVFENRVGQCAQYNGALVEMACYLGFDNVRFIKGMRSRSATTLKSPFSHYWAEVEIDGTYYCLETGNKADDSGSFVWYYFVKPYGATAAKKFVKCGLLLK
ncbi:MAG: hypothetical protein K5745_08720 [Saccharofermentans sp.]|nr:hypothetical protein [Saccharofermentans sp.]